MYLRNSSSVVAPMHCNSPRDRAGFSTLLASMAPSAPPAPTSVCSSSMNRIMFLAPADLVHHGLDALLELAAVLGAGDHHGEGRGRRCGAPAAGRGRCRPRPSGRSPPRWRSCRRPPRPAGRGLFFWRRQRDLGDPLDLVLPADDRVQLAVLGQFGEVPPEAVEGRRLALAAALAVPLAGPVAPAAAAVLVVVVPALKPWPSRLSTSSRTSSSFRPRFISTWAATPSCSRSRPSSRCSVPT